MKKLFTKIFFVYEGFLLWWGGNKAFTGFGIRKLSFCLTQCAVPAKHTEDFPLIERIVGTIVLTLAALFFLHDNHLDYNFRVYNSKSQ